MYKKGAGNDKQRKDAGNRTLCPYRNFSQAIKIGTRVLELHIILRPQSRYRDRNNENLIHGLSLYRSNSIVICLKVTPISFHEKCEISPVDMTSPDDQVITIRHTLHM